MIRFGHLVGRIFVGSAFVPVDLTKARAQAEQAARAWGVELGRPFPAGYSFVAPAGEDAVVKVAWDGDDESLHEADALELWAGDSAVRLLRRHGRALLLERARPGGDIVGLDDNEATAVAVGIARRLWRPAGPPFRPVTMFVPGWLERRPSPLTPVAHRLFAEMGASASWVVHGDLHHHNVLRHGDRFVAIDPKPYLADREYDAFSWLRNPLEEHPLLDRERTERRIAAFVAAGLDGARIRAWAVIRGSCLCDDAVELERLRQLLET